MAVLGGLIIGDHLFVDYLTHSLCQGHVFNDCSTHCLSVIDQHFLFFRISNFLIVKVTLNEFFKNKVKNVFIQSS